MMDHAALACVWTGASRITQGLSPGVIVHIAMYGASVQATHPDYPTTSHLIMNFSNKNLVDISTQYTFVIS